MRIGRYAHIVPEDLVANLCFRRDLLKWAREKPEHKETLKAMCRDDPVFMYGAFGWVHSPKTPETSVVLPLVLMPFQVELMQELVDGMEDQKDVRIPKSRDMAVSWTVMMTYYWYWRWRSDMNLLVGSRNESYVDEPGNHKALFQKMDFMHERMPGFLRCAATRTKLRFSNDLNGSVINGESMTKDFARGDRRSGLFMDEIAAGDPKEIRQAIGATVHVCNARVFASTFKPGSNAMDDVMALPDCREHRVHWTLWPSKRAGLYVGDRKTKVVTYLDLGYEYPEGYEFICDGKTRSPYYDAECRRTANSHEVALELDIDKVSAAYNFFDPPTIEELVEEIGRPAMCVGELEFDVIEVSPTVNRIVVKGFRHDPTGRLQLWFRPVGMGPPQDRQYGIGGDISAGTGASNTVLSCGDCKTGEKVAEFCSPSTLPHEAGNYAVALAKWLNDAMVCWEAPGPGREFGAMVLRAGYMNIWKRKNEATMYGRNLPGNARNPVPGWYPNNKDDVLETYSLYRQAICERKFLNRSVPALIECRQIIRHPNGRIVHTQAIGATDPSGAKDNHGDRPTADALCWKAMGGRGAGQPEVRVVEVNSIMWRRQEAARKRRAVSWV